MGSASLQRKPHSFSPDERSVLIIQCIFANEHACLGSQNVFSGRQAGRAKIDAPPLSLLIYPRKRPQVLRRTRRTRSASTTRRSRPVWTSFLLLWSTLRATTGPSSSSAMSGMTSFADYQELSAVALDPLPAYGRALHVFDAQHLATDLLDDYGVPVALGGDRLDSPRAPGWTLRQLRWLRPLLRRGILR